MAPAWMDQVPNIDFTPEKAAFRDIVAWGERLGLSVVPQSRLEADVRATTDLVLEQGRRRLHVRAQEKTRNGDGRIDLDARPRIRHVRLAWRPEDGTWETINDSNFVEELPWNEEGFARLVSKLFHGR